VGNGSLLEIDASIYLKNVQITFLEQFNHGCHMKKMDRVHFEELPLTQLKCFEN